MGCCSLLLKLSAVLAALLAVLVGLISSGVLVDYGIVQAMDAYQGSRGTFFKGMNPFLHQGTPWGFTEDQIPNLTDQTIIVTGANVGLGYWSTYHLAKAGASVVLACRTVSKCDAAVISLQELTGSTKLESRQLDLSSFASIRSFAADFASDHDRLDSLLLNAGVMAPPFLLTAEGLELQIGTNHFGHHLLAKQLLPLLERTAGEHGVSTVTVVASAAHYDSYPEGVRLSIEELNDEASYDRGKAYGQSKLANVLFAQELAARVKDKGILVNAIHPGAVDTNLVHHAVDAIKAFLGEAAGSCVEQIMQRLFPLILWTPRDAALTQVYATVAVEVKEQQITGKYFHPIARETKPDLHCANVTLQTGLWGMTEAFIASH